MRATPILPVGGIPGTRRIAMIAGDYVDGDTVAPGVVGRHRRVLQAYRPVRHRDRRLFVQTADELEVHGAAVVDQPLVQTAEARARFGAEVLEVERLEDVDQVVGTGALSALMTCTSAGGMVSS